MDNLHMLALWFLGCLCIFSADHLQKIEKEMRTVKITAS